MLSHIVRGAIASLAISVIALPVQAQSIWSSLPKVNSVQDKVNVTFPTRYKAGEIIVSFGDRRLYHVIRRGLAKSYPIAIPRAQSRWQGIERVTRKAVNPSWTPTAKMRRENPKLPNTVPGGHPRNPMGVRALYLGSTLYRIHGTDAPWTIGKNVSKGCIRMHNSHVIELYNRVKVGAVVRATWKRFGARAISHSASASGPSSQSSLADQLFSTH